jgi:hypothetical protein
MGPQGPAGPAGQDAASYWVVADLNGLVTRNSGQVTVNKVGPGAYSVTFSGVDAGQCAYSVNVDDSQLFTATADQDAGSVMVYTVDINLGVRADAPFHLVLFC